VSKAYTEMRLLEKPSFGQRRAEDCLTLIFVYFSSKEK